MTKEQLDFAVSQVKIDRLAWLASDDNPDEAGRERTRRWVEDYAERHARLKAKAAYPPVLTQLGTAAKAAARFIGSGCETVDRAEFDRRRAICAGCEHFDAKWQRCRQCGCSLAVKPWSKAEHCPLTPPKW